MAKIIYENNTYDFRESLTLGEFVILPYTLPINYWKEMAELLFGEFTVQTCKDILTRKLGFANNELEIFLYNNERAWLNKSERTAILNTLSYYTDDIFKLIVKENIVELSKDKAILFLKDLDLYSYKCKIKYQEYLNQINSLEEIQDLSFEFPKPLVLEDYI